jgi:hypothetical protein
MANDVTSAVWRIDTAPFTSSMSRVKVMNLNITGATSSDHVIITDLNSKPIVDFTASAGDLDYRIGNLGWVNGIKIASGGLGTTAIVTIAVGAGK